MLEIYWGSGSPYAWRVLLALEFKGLPYESKPISLMEGEQRSDAFLALNPRGKVPVMKDGDLVISESLAILAYLDKAYPEPALFGTTPEDTARIWQVIQDMENYLRPAGVDTVLPFYKGLADELRDDVERSAKTVATELAQWETSLGASPYLIGDKTTAADIAVYPFMKHLERMNTLDGAKSFTFPFLPLSPNITAWMTRMESMPGYDNTYPPHWRD